ncbi:unnamed protein product [Protopolystoma xenopodis]|uniref:Uncharacterized protein n=1 Tax=Protopolystoma xenopodis TaxID=117903 RepID=A0A448XAI0_9PLAT|nr:unnamed protein product [Protopolystoma xenopodis]
MQDGGPLTSEVYGKSTVYAVVKAGSAGRGTSRHGEDRGSGGLHTCTTQVGTNAPAAGAHSTRPRTDERRAGTSHSHSH